MEEIFIQLAFILFIAFVASYVVRLFKQPIIIGYIIAGIIVSPFILMTGVTNNIILIFSDLGIAFLLFIVGLHLNPKIIKEIGIASLLIGGAQIIFTFALGFIVSIFVLGYDIIPSAYIALALAFSSTIIIMKLLSDKGKLDSLGLINLIVTVEQNIEDDFDITITLADERAMSQEHSPFRTIKTLTDYIEILLEEKLND